MANKIVWRKWSDPLAPLLAGYEPEEDETSLSFADARKQLGVHLQLEQEETGSAGIIKGPVLTGPMGIIPLREANLPGKLFNFWMGDCNFNLSKRAVDAMERVPGVETLDVFTRYRFRMAVGRVFEEDDVMKAVEKAVRV